MIPALIFSGCLLPRTCPSIQLFSPQYNKHLFVHIGQSSPSYSDPYLEAVDIRQIYDKFPEKKGGLKELFERGPSNAFFLVKFWVSPSISSSFQSQHVDDKEEEREEVGIGCPFH